MKRELEFEHYLQEDGNTESTIERHLKNHEYFQLWTKSQGIQEIEYLNRNTIMEYVKFMQSNHLKVGTQNHRLSGLNKYYEFLKSEGVIIKNPVKGLRIRGKEKKVVHNILSDVDLIELLNGYTLYTESMPSRLHLTNQDAVNKRNILVVSLVVFQGLHTGELDKLTVQDVDIRNGTIYIPSTGRSNSRVLALHQSQSIPFYEYLNNLPADQQKLFSINVQVGSHHLLNQLKGINPTVSNLQHIRSSVLINWIKIHGKRKAQYMIGHKFASTTESYEVQDTSELSDLMERTHLFG